MLAGAGDHFCAGHDIGTPGRDIDISFERKAVMWWDHVGKQGADNRYAREMEVYLGMCRRWREMPKPTIAMVQGACIAGGLMLAWVCDLIVASDDAFFADPVVRMGIPGVEYFAHPWVLGPRFAKEMLFTGDRFNAARAYELGMVSRVVPRAELARDARSRWRTGSPAMPAFGLALAKRAVNQCEDQMGMRNGMDSIFGLHHVAHAHNAETGADSLAGHGRPVDEEGIGVNLDFEPAAAAVPGRGRRVAGGARARQPAAVGRHRRGLRAAPAVGSAAGRAPGSRRSPGRPSTAAADASLLEWLVFEEEYHAAGAPVRVGQNGLFVLAPTLLAHGTAEQRARILPPMARAEEVWAQAWSEPEAGSDLAALRSRAARDRRRLAAVRPEDVELACGVRRSRVRAVPVRSGRRSGTAG